jgi:CHAD domain-containing protein
MKKFAGDWQTTAGAGAEARRVLPALLRHYFRHGDRAVRPKTSDERLHEFRLATKRARYTLELFEPLYGAAVKPHLEGLKKVQQVLGQLNDCQASLHLLKELDGTGEKRLAKEAWLEAIELRRDKKRGEFARLWTEEFSDEAKRESWLAVVG